MMYIEYCETCQWNYTRQLEKCPQVMIPIKIEQKVWSKIGKCIISYSCTLELA